jgi:hypothetical protein
VLVTQENYLNDKNNPKLYVVDEAGNERPVGAVAVDISLLGFGEDSQFQNSAEFIAATIGLLGLILLGLDGSAVRLRGDSMSALCWGAKMNYKGARTANAALVFTLLLVQAEVTVVDFEYLTSNENFKTDDLSRQSSVEEVVQRCPELKGVQEVRFPPLVLERTLRDCDPRMVLDDDLSFSLLWRRLRVLKEELLGRGGRVGLAGRGRGGEG